MDANIALFGAHLTTLGEERKLQHARKRHRMDVNEAALDLAASAANHDTETGRKNDDGDQANV